MRRCARAVVGRSLSVALLLFSAASLIPLVTSSTPAAAFDLFGVHLWGERSEPDASPDAQPHTITFHVTSDDPALEDRLKAASSLWSERDGRPSPSTPAFLSRATADYGRLLGALRGAGFYGGTIAITADGRPVEALAGDTVLPHPVAVVVTITSGPRFAFGSVAVAGRPSRDPAAEADPRIPTPERLGLIADAPARADTILAAEQALIDAWKRLGHPKVKVLPRSVVARHPDRRVDVAIAVDPGPAAVFGPVAVSGTRDMDPAFVARQTGIPTGERWDPADLTAAQRRLRRLQVFSSVRFVEDDAVAADGSLGVTAQVAERLRHVFGGGASYSSIDGAGVEGYWQHRNLFGRAESLKIEGRVGGMNSADPRDFSYLAGATFVKPGVITPFTDFTAQLVASREVLDAYTQDTARARVGLMHEFDERLTGKLAANIEFDRADDAFGRRDLVLASLPAELAWDGSDDKLAPSRGIRAKFATEPFWESRRGVGGAILRLDASTYAALDPQRRFILAGRIAAGSILGADAADLPPDRLFFAGGGRSVRGYAYRSLGPKGPGGQVAGGRSLAEASLELRMKVTDTIGVVPFVDAGGAFAASAPDFSRPLAIGAGLGLRYYTSLGAIRVDVGVPLDRRRSDSPFALYIGLGESF